MPKKSSCFPVVARADARLLILGSLPGGESLRLGQYYALKQNAFWQIMGRLLNFSVDAPYADRLQALLDHRIALWDVCAAAHRIGSLDSAIRKVEANDFAAFFKSHPAIELVCFNGATAEALFTRKVMLDPLTSIQFKRLPSTSPAHARMRPHEKYSAWAEVLKPFL